MSKKINPNSVYQLKKKNKNLSIRLEGSNREVTRLSETVKNLFEENRKIKQETIDNTKVKLVYGIGQLIEAAAKIVGEIGPIK